MDFIKETAKLLMILLFVSPQVDSKEIVFVNHHIKEMFFEQEERDVFASMMKLKNYMQ